MVIIESIHFIPANIASRFSRGGSIHNSIQDKALLHIF